MEPPDNKRELPRKLGTLDATAIVIGIVIGSGIFVLPNLIARNLPSASAITLLRSAPSLRTSDAGAPLYMRPATIMWHSASTCVTPRPCTCAPT